MQCFSARKTTPTINSSRRRFTARLNSGVRAQRHHLDNALEKRLTDLDDWDQRVRADLAADGSLFEGYHPRMEAVHRANAAQLREIMRITAGPDFH